MEKVCEGEDLRVANGRISPSRSPFLTTAEKRMAGMEKRIKYKVIMKKVSITLKAVDVFDYGAADFLAGHLENMKWGYINCCAFDGVLTQMFL